MKPALLIAILPILAGCSASTRDEVARANSPDGLTQAILFETNGGATTSYGYEIELRSASDQNAAPVEGGTLYGATRSSCSYGVNLRWSSPTALRLEFMEADNVVIPTAVTVGNKTIAIAAQAGVSDDNAPCGGMLASRG